MHRPLRHVQGIKASVGLHLDRVCTKLEVATNALNPLSLDRRPFSTSSFPRFMCYTFLPEAATNALDPLSARPQTGSILLSFWPGCTFFIHPPSNLRSHDRLPCRSQGASIPRTPLAIPCIVFLVFRPTGIADPLKATRPALQEPEELFEAADASLSRMIVAG